MGSCRDEFLVLLKGNSVDDFCQIGRRHMASSDAFSLDEVFDGLSLAETRDVWDAVLGRVAAVVESQEHLTDKTCPALTVLHTATLLAIAFLADEARKPSASMFGVAEHLHDVLLLLQGEQGSAIQNDISTMCEQWWSLGRSGKESLVPQTISYLLVRSLGDQAKMADVKRVYAFREALRLIDFADESAVSLKRLLLRCLIHPVYLRCSQGRLFCVNLFGLFPPYIEHLHATIKNQLPACRKSILDAYGEIYFKAWRGATGPYLSRIEFDCVQDLMEKATHARVPSLCSAIRRVLNAFTRQKKQRGVDQLLARLYEPILWRSLKVANPAVRRNALGLLVDAFPLIDPDQSQADMDTGLQRQFDILNALLGDPAVLVRTAAVKGTANILGIFWEVIPLAVARDLVTRLVTQLAHDTSSTAIRVATFEGLAFLVDNHLAQPTLKGLLPKIGKLIHDTSERVRLAVADLLLAVKRVKAIRFWNVVPVEELLARLPVDSVRMARKITELLLHTYFPVDKPLSVQLERCLKLIRGNKDSAAVFYAHLSHFANVADICNFAEALNGALSGALEEYENPSKKVERDHDDDDEEEEIEGPQKKKAKKGRGRPGKTTKAKKETNKRASAKGKKKQETNKRESAKGKKGKKKTEKNETATTLFDPSDIPAVEGVLFTVAQLLHSVAATLGKPSHAQMKEQVVEIFAGDTLPRYMSRYTSTRSREAILQIARHLPPSEVPHLAEGFLPKLCQLEDDAPVDHFSAMLACLFSWGMGGKVVDLLEASLGGTSAPVRQAKKPKRSKKGASKEDEVLRCTPSLALRLLSHLLATDTLRDTFLGDVDRHARVLGLLEGKTKELLEVLQSPDTRSDVTDSGLLAAISVRGRLAIHLAVPLAEEEGREDKDSLAVIKELVEAAVSVGIPAAGERVAARAAGGDGEEEEEEEKAGDKRAAGPEEDLDLPEAPCLAYGFLEVVLSLVHECVALMDVGVDLLDSTVALVTGLLVLEDDELSSLVLGIGTKILWHVAYKGSECPCLPDGAISITGASTQCRGCGGPQPGFASKLLIGVLQSTHANCLPLLHGPLTEVTTTYALEGCFDHVVAAFLGPALAAVDGRRESAPDTLADLPPATSLVAGITSRSPTLVHAVMPSVLARMDSARTNIVRGGEARAAPEVQRGVEDLWATMQFATVLHVELVRGLKGAEPDYALKNLFAILHDVAPKCLEAITLGVEMLREGGQSPLSCAAMEAIRASADRLKLPPSGPPVDMMA